MNYYFESGQEYAGVSLGRFLRKKCMLSASLVRSLKMSDGIFVEGKPQHTDYVMCGTEKVHIVLSEDEGFLSPCGIQVPVEYESGGVIVFDKPAGMATHPTLNYPEGTLANVYARMCMERGFSGASFRPVCRLDKNTSGLLPAAKDRYAASVLAASHKKEYVAVVEGTIEKDGFVELPIARGEDSIIQRVISPEGDYSLTEYHVIDCSGAFTLLRVVTHTGRTHQIRVHMSAIGHPLAGDDMYGGSVSQIARHALHCSKLSFYDPAESREVLLESPVPEDMVLLMKYAGLQHRTL